MLSLNPTLTPSYADSSELIVDSVESVDRDDIVSTSSSSLSAANRIDRSLPEIATSVVILPRFTLSIGLQFSVTLLSPLIEYVPLSVLPFSVQENELSLLNVNDTAPVVIPTPAKMLFSFSSIVEVASVPAADVSTLSLSSDTAAPEYVHVPWIDELDRAVSPVTAETTLLTALDAVLFREFKND